MVGGTLHLVTEVVFIFPEITLFFNNKNLNLIENCQLFCFLFLFCCTFLHTNATYIFQLFIFNVLILLWMSMCASSFHPGYSSLPSVNDEGDFAEHRCICKSRIFERNEHFWKIIIL